MGMLFSKLYYMIQSNKPCRIVMVGLDAAGKTTLLYKLKLGEVVTSIPTIGFNVETIDYKNISFTVWDIGGQKTIRPLWHHYFQNTKGVIYVVDSNDPQRFNEAKDELFTMLESYELQDCPLLVYVNKQDLPFARKPDEVCESLGLTTLKDRKWYIQSTVATTGEGVFDGLDWLAQNVP